MKIYTYYEQIGFEFQDQLIELWKQSWSKQGFDPVVLDINHAQKHPYYETFCENMRIIYGMLTGQPLSLYGLSCFTRWMAYATQNKQYNDSAPEDGEIFYVSDYDVMNTGKWTPTQHVSSQLQLLDDACPCLSTGTSKQYETLCYAFYDVTMNRYDYLKTVVTHYHDQEFFLYNFTDEFNSKCEHLKQQYDMVLTRDQHNDVAPYDPTIETPSLRAYHVSHENADAITDMFPSKYKHMAPEQSRVEICKEILNLST